MSEVTAQSGAVDFADEYTDLIIEGLMWRNVEEISADSATPQDCQALCEHSNRLLFF